MLSAQQWDCVNLYENNKWSALFLTQNANDFTYVATEIIICGVRVPLPVLFSIYMHHTQVHCPDKIYWY